MNKFVEKMRTMLLGRPEELMLVFNDVVKDFEARIAAEKKRADDLEESIRAIRADFPQETRKFKTDIGTKG